MQETFVESLGWEYTLEKKMTTYYSIPAWGIPLGRQPWQATFHEIAKEPEMLDWKKHKLKSRLPGEISITSDMQMTPPL